MASTKSLSIDNNDSFQRRKTISGMFWGWITRLLLLIVTYVVNTALLDEIVGFLNDNMTDVAR